MTGKEVCAITRDFDFHPSLTSCLSKCHEFKGEKLRRDEWMSDVVWVRVISVVVIYARVGSTRTTANVSTHAWTFSLNPSYVSVCVFN